MVGKRTRKKKQKTKRSRAEGLVNIGNLYFNVRLKCVVTPPSPDMPDCSIQVTLKMEFLEQRLDIS